MSDSASSVKGYEVFFGFREPPFSLAPDTRFLFDGASHAAAREQVAYALERREPLVVVTGEIGTGKTLLCRSVVQQLERRTFLSIVHDPMLDRDDLLKQVLQDFGVISKDRTRLAPATRHELVHALQEFLLSLVPLRAHAVLVIDEAQHLQPDVLEQLRLLSNVHDDGGTLLQIVLVGQPTLEAVMSRPELRQLKQRVSRHVRLEPLGIAELSQYIDHRLAVARDGARPQGAVTFGSEALSAIWRLSGGTPRVINLLCDRALEAAYEQQAQFVDAPLVEAAATELGIHRGTPAAAALPAPALPTVAPPVEPPLIAWPAPDELPVVLGDASDLEPPRAQSRRVLVIAAAVVVVAAVAWFAVRGSTGSPPANPSFTAAAPPPAERQPPPAAAPSADTSPATPAPGPSAAPPPVLTPAPSTPPAGAVPSATLAQPGTPAAGASTSPELPAAASTGPFEIVVASFRTTTRAAEVAAELTALGQPVRQRSSDGWQQVLAGPFPTRESAQTAQARLDSAGYTGTQIVPAPR